MFTERRKFGGQRFAEVRNQIGRFLEVFGVQHKPNCRHWEPVVGATIDLGFENLHAMFPCQFSYQLEQQTLSKATITLLSAANSTLQLLPEWARDSLRPPIEGDTAQRICLAAPKALEGDLLQQCALAPEQRYGRRAGRLSVDAR
jgi:hypothetical protein